MPKTKRDFMKRKLAHAYHNLDVSGAFIQELIDIFEPVHPEMTDGLKIVQSLILNQMQILGMFALAAWGTEQPNWDAWRNEPE